MELYSQIIPDSADPVLTLELGKKSGRIPKGTYSFVESYCADPGCDDRRVVLLVLNEKRKQKAVINFGFDQDSAFSGPYLDSASDQSPYADQLLDFFADSLNSDHTWLEQYYRHYREVREKLDKKPYRGKDFPKAGKLVYRATPPPDLEAEMLQSLENLRASGRAPARPVRPVPKPQPAPAPVVKGQEVTVASLVARYGEAGVTPPIEKAMKLRGDLRKYLMDQDDAGEELAVYLPELCRQSPQDDDAINAGLRLLFDALNLLKEESERGAKEASERMENLQRALARWIFVENEDLDLTAAVWNMVAQSRVEILPVLREAIGKTILDGDRRTDLKDLPGEEIMSGIARSLDSIGVTSPFEGAQEMLQLFTLNEPEMQVALIGEMLAADKTLLREISALMLFHPQAEVRRDVSQLLAAQEGSSISPETLLRLIVSRSWLPEQIRRNVDQVISKARRGRVECAPLGKPSSVTVLASILDGSGAQFFHVMVPDGSGFSHCDILLKEGLGVAETVVAPLKSKGEVTGAVSQLKKEGTIIDSTPEYLDLRVCHALAAGVRGGSPPNHWLVRVAELLGRDRWRPIAFDAARELLLLWEELDSHNRKLLDEGEYRTALEESGKWQQKGSLLSSWHLDDAAALQELDKSQGGKKRPDAEAAAENLVETVLENNRQLWLERLVVTAMWLQSCAKPPLPWHRVFHVAQAVADETVALKEVPLMLSIARSTVAAHQARQEKQPTRPGGKQ